LQLREIEPLPSRQERLTILQYFGNVQRLIHALNHSQLSS